jgi:hypothetical protein
VPNLMMSVGSGPMRQQSAVILSEALSSTLGRSPVVEATRRCRAAWLAHGEFGRAAVDEAVRTSKVATHLGRAA